MITDMAQVNIASREHKANPYPFYAHLREHAPVYPTSIYKRRAWLITRYDDVVSVLKDDQRFVKRFQNAVPDAKEPSLPAAFKPLIQHMLEMDWVDHARLRGLVHKAFTPRMIEKMQSRVEGLAQELIERAQAKRQIDLIADYALPIPMTIISEMLGIEPKDQPKFHRWVKFVLEKKGRANPLIYVPQALMIARFLRGEIKKRQQNPQDDLMTALVQAREVDDRLSDDELLSTVFIILVAGYETTINLISSGALALIQHPDQADLLHRNPALIKSAVEELLRFTNPLDLPTERFAAQDVTLHGVTISRGDLVFPVLASANRDERVFENPDVLDITRENNKHIAFGLGVHYCVGAPLARLEGSIAINTLMQCAPTLRLGVAADALKWRPGYQVRGLESLPVTW